MWKHNQSRFFWRLTVVSENSERREPDEGWDQTDFPAEGVHT